jgi:hypothetical protein
MKITLETAIIKSAIFIAKVVVFCVIFNSLCFFRKIGF